MDIKTLKLLREIDKEIIVGPSFYITNTTCVKNFKSLRGNLQE